MKYTPEKLIAVDDSVLLDVIAKNGIEAMLAAHEMKIRVHRRKDPSGLLERFDDRFGFPFERLRFSIGPSCDCGVVHDVETFDANA